MKVLLCALLVATASGSALSEEAWPSDFQEKLAAHIAANQNANVRANSADSALDATAYAWNVRAFGTDESPFDSFAWRMLASAPSRLMTTEFLGLVLLIK